MYLNWRCLEICTVQLKQGTSPCVEFKAAARAILREDGKDLS
jgi:hypothetical protein